ncbi:MAG: peptidylprolyl isomerase [Candidatus Sericytochromatia bacterium]|nr:MAG: peptidylprolyl isomerase [Candidatus Sericytochromatia bacterium]
MEYTKKEFYINLSLGLSLTLLTVFSAYTFGKIVFEGKNIIATVNGKAISSKEFKDTFSRIKNSFTAQSPVDFKTDNGFKDFDNLRKKAIEELTLSKIIYQKAEEKNILVTEDMVNSELQKIKADTFRNNESQYRKALKDRGLTEQALLKILKDRLTFQKLMDKLFEENIKITEEDLKKAYESKIFQFTQEEAIEAQHILVKDQKLANEIYDRLQKGEDFDSLAQKYSEDPGSKSNGGRLGYFQKGMMVPEFEKTAWSLKLNEISKPVKTNFGYHIIKKTGYKPKSVVSYKDARPIVESDLKEEKKRAFVMEWTKKALEEADIVYTASYKNLELKKEEKK